MNFEQDQIESLESNIEHWMLSDEYDMKQTFGEDLYSAVKEALSDD